MSKAKELLELIKAPGILVMPGVYDGFSTRLVEKMGFKAASIGNSGLSESRLGWADVGIIGYDESVHASASLAACTNIPLQADADTGYGNAVNVHFTVKGYEKGGLAAVMIEDQVWPKRCGHMAGKQVISAEEGVEKIRAAVEARSDILIKARTDAFATHGVDEAIRRLNLYAEAGADFLVADALLTRDDIRTVAKNVTAPLVVNMGFGIRKRPTTELIPIHELEDMGVAVVTLPRLLTASAMKGMMNALEAFGVGLRERKLIEREDLLVSFEEINELMGFQTIAELQEKFVSSMPAVKH
ncbi:isocitrate lyase/PEP mutase family protein [Paraburkholderia fynbosensis]|uniref:2,3-dimethylmalate lyase n=1 Tax=Paraburkholderia fynbosensis TaxID=1200993 RepID=A0A6J5H2Q8_9BURK|nr:isocitrate lyase/PEP mutase family protein [Paraburkholderia fynbosensis]CAB3809741.1 2,3-dimethylmalate lyase [Paraburkholderia fynbosensis]